LIVIIIPVLRRPWRVQPLVDSIEANTLAEHRTLFVASPGDDDEIAAINDVGAEWIETPEQYPSGDYARKINLAYRASWEPLMFLGADDLCFHPDWFEKASAKFGGDIGVVGTNDLGNRRVMQGVHATHSLVSREYIDRHGTIDEPHKVLHEGYQHNWVDTEFVGTAQHRGAFISARESVVEHLHPHWNADVPVDSTYEHGLSGFERDRRYYLGRQHLWNGR